MYDIYDDTSQVIKLLNEALKIDFEFIDALIYKYLYLEKIGDNNEAKNIALFLAVDKNHFSGYNLLGRYYYKKNDFDNAIINYKKALEISDNISSYIDLGLIEEIRGNWDEAKSYYLKGLTFNSKETAPYFRLGYLYLFKIKNYDTAVYYFSKAIELDNAQIIYKYYINSLLLIKKVDKAKELNNQFIELYGNTKDSDFFEIVILNLEKKYDKVQLIINEFVASNTPADINWLKKELKAWGINVEK